MARRTKKFLSGRQDFPEVLSLEERLAWLRLSRTENIGPVTFYHLLNRYGSAEEALRRLPEIAYRGGRRDPLVIPSMREALAEWEETRALGGTILAKPEKLYPPLLKELPDAPPLLTVQGDLSLLERPCFSIVGSRNASVSAREMAATLSEELARVGGFVIVSGMARGVDGCAHKGALNFGTIAILAGGIDQVYPPEHKDLYKEIAQKGLLMSESPLGTPPHPTLFPKRNRLISGCSWGILVIEAEIKSGSLITAHLAGEQGREVFAVPGHPMDPRAKGTNELIKEGAILTQSAQDILLEYRQLQARDLEEEPAPFEVPSPSYAEAEVERVRLLLMESLSNVPQSIERLIDFCQAPVHLIRAALIEMEITGYLERHFGDRVSMLPQGLRAPEG